MSTFSGTLSALTEKTYKCDFDSLWVTYELCSTVITIRCIKRTYEINNDDRVLLNCGLDGPEVTPAIAKVI